jgi:transcriptional regulator with XRE-family HTH domain
MHGSIAQMIAMARRGSGLSQVGLAERSATSQATLSAYESGRKVPNAATLARILAAAGYRLELAEAERPVVTPTRAEHERVSRSLRDVLALAAALPTSHRREPRFPRLPTGGGSVG